MKKTFYQYCVLLQPTKKEAEEGKSTEVVVAPSDVTWVLASSDAEASMIAARKVPESMMDKADRLEVAVRPF